jgi:nitrite reductase/ring-hydroxylating ferredoxin subunit
MTMSLTGRPLDVASADDLLRHGRLVVSPEGLGTAVLLLHTRRGVFAVENQCPHRGSPLVDARVRGATLTCSMHGWRYDLRSDRCVSRPGHPIAPARTWPVYIADGRVWLVPSV